MLNVSIGCGQITWRGLEKSQNEILAEIAQAGYAGAPAGPYGDVSAHELLDQYASHGLKPAPGYLGVDFWDKGAEEQIFEQAHRFGSFSQVLGLTELYVAAGGFNDYITPRGLSRAQVSGHVTVDDGMTDEEFDQFAKVLTAVGRITLEYGVSSCFHNHVGSTIETRAEIDRLFSMVIRDVVFMGPDTGHLEWAGESALQFCRDYASAIRTIHIKDIDAAVLAEGVAAEWDYGTFTDNGIWTELGQGAIDFPAIFAVLDQAGFNGWIIVETDDTQLDTPLESAVVSRAYLRELGI